MDLEKVFSPFKKFFRGIAKRFSAFGERFMDGSIGTKITHFIIGSGSIMHGQIVKGLLYFGLFAAFIAFMVFCPVINNTPFGYKALVNLVTLGERRPIDIFSEEASDNSMLMLLFGVITLGIIAVMILVWLSNIKSSYKADLDERDGKKPTTFVEDVKALFDEKFHVLMLTPTCLAALVFTILPTLFMILIAFTNYDSTVTDGIFDWVGLKNFFNIFDGKGEISVRFLPVLSWTVIWAVLATFSNYFGGILLALLINKKEVKFKKLWRTIFIMTIALPQFISLLAVRNLLSLNGPVNNMLVNLHLLKEPIEFLSLAPQGSKLPHIAILLTNLWIGVPYTMLMTSGILMNIPQDLYEAATIDGANKNQMFRKITLPYIIFVTTPYLISSFIGNINSFNVIFLLTGGGPTVPGFFAGETDLLVTWLYKLTIDQYDYNTGAVVGILTFIITSSITLFTYRRSKAYKEEDTFQ